MANRIAYRVPSGSLAYYYPTCQRCGKPKGRSSAPLCIRCGHWANAPRSGILLDCPDCGHRLDRDGIIVAMHYAGISNRRIAATFNLTAVRIGQIVRAWEAGRHRKA